jgi:tetratricopeptide (TPR) repeat protein
MNLHRFFLTFIALALTPLANLLGQDAPLDFDQWVFPEFSWKEEDFQNRFLGRYGVNGYTEPQMDVENYNAYEATMALIEDKKEAIAYLAEAIKSLDESGIQASAALHFVLASMLYEENEKQAAVEQYVLAIRKHPSFLRAYANLGFTLMELDKTEQALPVLLKAVELGANESQIHGLIGRIYQSKQLYESGLTAFRNALVFSPENNSWRFGVLQCLIALERYAEAITMADEVLAFGRRDASNWRNRAGLLARLERWDEAIVDFQTAHSLGGATFDSLLSLTYLFFNKGIYPQAAISLAQATELAESSDNFDTLLSTVQSLSSTGQVEEALALISAIETRSAQQSVELDRSIIQRIQVAAELKNDSYENALPLLDALIEDAPGDGQLHLMRAQTLIGLQQVEDAILAFQIAATIEDVAYAANYDHARLELSRGQIPSALKLLQTAYAIEPSEALRSYIRELEAFEE